MKKDKIKTGVVSGNKNILNEFDDIIFQHLERLIGSRFGVGELAMNSVTISLIMLLMERENEIKSFPSDEINRYESETLLNDFKELGFDAAYDVSTVVEEMVRKGYLQTEDGRLIPQRPAISMARLIDKVFPKMPGMNLVAYFVQTMDEVTSGRKDLDSATSQFDQVLQMQSVPLKNETKQSNNEKASKASADSENTLKSPVNSERKSSDNPPDHSTASPAGPKVLSSDVYKGKFEIRKVDFGEPGLDDIESDTKSSDELDAAIDLDDVESDTKSSDELDAILNKTPGTQINQAEKEPHDHADSKISSQELNIHTEEPEQAGFVTQNSYKTASDVNETAEDGPDTADEKENPFINDADIERRITAFEEDLALECPICRQSKVTVENTATGKFYYKCSNRDCNFISWGRPYHISCPKCNNLFLIEAASATGETILKCPRATCRYRKKGLPDIWDDHRKNNESTSHKSNQITSVSRKPRRKVVRRRVVRRKK